jgi:hypothetical protein
VYRVLELKELGKTDREVSAATCVPVDTIRTRRRGRLSEAARHAIAGTALCDVCGHLRHTSDEVSPSTYAYLLGVYLGDGCWRRRAGHGASGSRSTAAYPTIAEEVCAAITDLRGRRAKPHPVVGERCLVVASSWRSWICLLPQHGPGKKHRRRIELLPWQQDLVEQAPGALLRGLIHTDGWRGVNRVVSKGKRYEYLRYQFS